MKFSIGKQTGLGTTAKVAALAALLALTACATEPVDDGAGRTIDMPLEWDEIDLAEADLTLPLVAPLDIATLGRRIGEGQAFENLYTFHGLKGYVLTSRIAFGSYTERFSKTLRSLSNFKAHVAELSLPPGGEIEVLEAQPFLNGKPLTRGYVAKATAAPYHNRCFVARIGYVMVEYASVERDPDSVDTVIEALLCGNLPKETVLLDMLMKVKAVEDRAAFRRELARRPIGTI
jgi:hypothetical protein